MIKKCKDCGKMIKVYNTLNRRCKECTIKNFKPINPVGKKTQKWMGLREIWLEEDKNANGYWTCECCGRTITNRSQVVYHHSEKRSTHPESVFDRKKLKIWHTNCHENWHIEHP